MTTEETASVSQTPVTIDYTNRDFYSLREELIARVKERTGNSWFGTDSSDFGVALVEAFAYMGDITAYYIDRVANETNLITASQRESIINLALTYGYTPAGYQAASCTLLFTNSSLGDVTIPSGTEVYGKVIDGDIVRQIIFTTTADVTVAAEDSNTVTASHGYYVSARNPASGITDIAGELLGSSTGLPNQSFTLSQNQVVDGSVRLFVQNGDNFGEWSYVLHLSDYGPTDSVFTTSTDKNNFVSVVFGDGVSGALPPLYSQVKVDYIVGGGVTGNVAQYALTNFYSIPGLTAEELAVVASSITVTNTTAANGGIDPDSLETIKALAPLSFSTLNRAVTLDDYTNLAQQIPQVGKASAVSEVGSSVTLYVAPRRVDTSTDPYPLYSDDNTTLTVEWDAGNSTGLKYTVQNELANKCQLGVSLTVSPPTYIPVKLTILYNKLPQYTYTQVETQIKALLNSYYSYALVYFGQTIYPEDIEFLLKYAPGVTNVNVIEMYRSTQTAGRDVLVGAENELFVFSPTDVAISAASGDATLTSLSTNTGTVSPTFVSDFLVYNLIVSTGTSSVTITPVAADTMAATVGVYREGVKVSSGGATSITTSSTTTHVTIRVTAEDQVTVKTYTLTITKA